MYKLFYSFLCFLVLITKSVEAKPHQSMPISKLKLRVDFRLDSNEINNTIEVIVANYFYSGKQVTFTSYDDDELEYRLDGTILNHIFIKYNGKQKYILLEPNSETVIEINSDVNKESIEFVSGLYKDVFSYSDSIHNNIGKLFKSPNVMNLEDITNLDELYKYRILRYHQALENIDVANYPQTVQKVIKYFWKSFFAETMVDIPPKFLFYSKTLKKNDDNYNSVLKEYYKKVFSFFNLSDADFKYSMYNKQLSDRIIQDTIYFQIGKKVAEIDSQDIISELKNELQLQNGDNLNFIVANVFLEYPELIKKYESKWGDSFANESILSYVEYIVEENIRLEKQKNKQIISFGNIAPENIVTTLNKKFEGKAIVVDFWATWCVPCKIAMKETQSIKTKYKNDVEFVYLTTTSSPENQWLAEISFISGYHGYLTDAQWKYIFKKYNHATIPFYIFLKKDGSISQINGFLDEYNFEESLKKTLLD